jgi:hypothetical protein
LIHLSLDPARSAVGDMLIDRLLLGDCSSTLDYVFKGLIASRGDGEFGLNGF